MEIRSRPDGSHYPISTKTVVSMSTFSKVASQDGRRRSITRKQRATLSSLTNPLLWSNFKKKLERLNPSFDVDQHTNRDLEPGEALFDLKKKFPELDIGLNTDDDQAKGFREFLDDFGISNGRVQSMVAMVEPPLSETELAQLSMLLNNRPAHAVAVDRGLRAPIARDVRQWIDKPDRVDIEGIDR